MGQERVRQHVVTLADIFDTARGAMKTPFSFASDISESARPIAIDGSLEMIERGNHREAMFWIAVTHSRCQKVLSHDAPEELTPRSRDSYRELVGDLAVSSFAEVRQHCAEVERILPQVSEMAEAIIGANQAIADD
jgi:hypothetical protein